MGQVDVERSCIRAMKQGERKRGSGREREDRRKREREREAANSRFSLVSTFTTVAAPQAEARFAFTEAVTHWTQFAALFDADSPIYLSYIHPLSFTTTIKYTYTLTLIT